MNRFFLWSIFVKSASVSHHLEAACETHTGAAALRSKPPNRVTQTSLSCVTNAPSARPTLSQQATYSCVRKNIKFHPSCVTTILTAPHHPPRSGYSESI